MRHPLIDRLEEVGYVVALRRHAWSEVLVRGFGEVWIGHGTDEAEALRHAVRQMCPSRLAEQALGPVGFGAERSGGATARPPLARKEDGEFPSPERSIEALETLSERIRDLRPELAACSAERQRLCMLAWICEARAAAELHPEDGAIREWVTGISRTLTDIGKAYWPGSVTALQLHIQPRELPRHLLGGTASTWSEAAEMAERALRTAESGAGASGRDAFGYADGAHLDPPPEAPEGLLHRLVAELEAEHGSLERGAEPEHGRDRVPDPNRFRGWVRQVRWLRRSAVDVDTWARAMGRLRWWSHRRAQLPTLELDADFAPDRPWAEHVPEVSPGTGRPPPLRPEARAALEGRRLLFVGHRRDPELMALLQREVSDLRVDFRLAEAGFLRQLQSNLGEGGYAWVAGALGLQDKVGDSTLAAACRDHDVPYLRVHFNDPNRVLEGLSRGLTSATPS